MQIDITPYLSIYAKGRDLFLRIYTYEKPIVGKVIKRPWIEGDFYSSYYNYLMGLEKSETYSEAVMNLKEAEGFIRNLKFLF